MKYGVWFCGSDDGTPDWLRNRVGDVLAFDTEEQAYQMRDLLYAGAENIEIRGVEDGERKETGIAGASEPGPD